MRVKRFSEFLNEGGWSTTKTQETVLNPLAIKESLVVIGEIQKSFNEYLRTIDLPVIDFGHPVGSGTWWKDDLENNPDKVYGDIDLLVTYPVLRITDDKKKNESESLKIYNAELLKWLKSVKPNGVDVEETEKVSNPSTIKLITKIPSGYVQVDMVATHEEYKDWASARLTPVRNIKGFVLGNLYTSFGKTLDVSIQLKGVRAKIKDGMIVPYSKRSGVEEILISNSMKTFMYDIAKFIWEKSTKQKFEPTEDLVNWSMNSKSPSIEDLMKGIKAVVNTLDKLDEWGSTIKYKSKEDFLNAVFENYKDVMMKNYNASKFNKAQSKQAVDTIKRIRKTITDNISLVKSLI
jgi:hypothetical protein